MVAVGKETWQARAFDRRRAFAVMHELSPLLAIGAERRNTFALHDHTFWMWWRSPFPEDRDLCHELAERASSVGPRPRWEHALTASLSHTASTLGLQLDERLLLAWGDVKVASGYRLVRPRKVVARLDVTASVRRFVVEAELARPLPESTYARAPRVRKPALLALRGEPVIGAAGREKFLQIKGAPLDSASFDLPGILQMLPAEVSECETGTHFRVNVGDVEAISSVHALVWATIQAAARFEDSW